MKGKNENSLKNKSKMKPNKTILKKKINLKRGERESRLYTSRLVHKPHSGRSGTCKHMKLAVSIWATKRAECAIPKHYPWQSASVTHIDCLSFTNKQYIYTYTYICM